MGFVKTLMGFAGVNTGRMIFGADAANKARDEPAAMNRAAINAAAMNRMVAVLPTACPASY